MVMIVVLDDCCRRGRAPLATIISQHTNKYNKLHTCHQTVPTHKIHNVQSPRLHYYMRSDLALPQRSCRRRVRLLCAKASVRAPWASWSRRRWLARRGGGGGRRFGGQAARAAGVAPLRILEPLHELEVLLLDPELQKEEKGKRDQTSIRSPRAIRSRSGAAKRTEGQKGPRITMEPMRASNAGMHELGANSFTRKHGCELFHSQHNASPPHGAASLDPVSHSAQRAMAE